MLRTILDAPEPGKGRRVRQKTKWKDSCKRDMESVGLNVRKQGLLGRTKWKNDIQHHSDDPR